MIVRLWSGQVHSDSGRYDGAQLLRDDAGLYLSVGDPARKFRLDDADARGLWAALGEALQGGA